MLFFCKPKQPLTVDGILADFNQKIADLAQVSQEQAENIVTQDAIIAAAHQNKQKSQTEMERANSVAEKIKALIA